MCGLTPILRHSDLSHLPCGLVGQRIVALVVELSHLVFRIHHLDTPMGYTDCAYTLWGYIINYKPA